MTPDPCRPPRWRITIYKKLEGGSMTLTLEREARRHVSLFSDTTFSPGVSTKTYSEDGESKLVSVHNVPIFRSGTFRDSMGYQHEWSPLHIAQMVTNFEYLRDSNIFSDVPVRAGHPSFLGDPIRDVIGYITELRSENMTSPHDGKEYTYLVADFSVEDEESARKIDSGLWRNRSSEIGSYVTNSEMELWPTVMGFAYVDIPAVEGLNFSKSAVTEENHSLIFDLKENPTMASSPGAAHSAPPAIPAPPAPPAASAPAAPPAAAPAPAFEFSLRGEKTTDFAAVQRHISVLEQAEAEQAKASRSAFVTSLVESGKIFAAQAEGFTEVVLEMDDSRFSKFKKLYDGAPQLPVLGEHVVNNHSHPGHAPAQSDQLATEVLEAQEIVARHQMSGIMSVDQIKATRSYGILVANNAVPAGF